MTRNVASWLTPTSVMTIPAAMLTEPSLTSWRTSVPAVVKLKWRKLAGQRRSLTDVAVPVGNAVVEVVHHEDLSGRRQQVEDQADRQDADQPGVGLGVGDPADDQPTESEQDDGHQRPPRTAPRGFEPRGARESDRAVASGPSR